MPDITQLLIASKPHIDALANYQFNYNNPVFWAGLCVIFMLFSLIWELKKAAGFCVSLALVLLASTKIKTMAIDYALKSGETFDPAIVNVLCAVIVFFILLYYFFMKKQR